VLRNTLEYQFFGAFAATGADGGVDVGKYRRFVVYFAASVVTSGATIKVESLSPNGDWTPVNSNAISANGNTMVAFEGAHSKLRCNITARTDGTYTATLRACD